MRRYGFALFTLGAIVSSPGLAADIDYLRDIKPLLQSRCVACHGAVRQKAGLRLDAASLLLKGGKGGPVVLPGRSGESSLIDAVQGKDRSRMPPESEGTALSEKEVSLLRAWIDAGARAPDEPIPPDPRQHWAFRPPVRSAIPKVASPGATPNPVDAFVAHERSRQGLAANPPADRATLLRRVHLDLTGLPPSAQEVQTFLADDAPGAYERVVDRLLASPHYGERWGRHAMDIWRYSDPFGFQNEFRYSQRHIWRWRDWIVESLNADRGYDRMIVDMLAGDEVAPADRDTLRATGYLARNWYKFNRNAWLFDTVEHTAAGFLGLTMRCARCHDHKYDPLNQQDYYRFRAFFEPHEIRIDPVPGQPDTAQDGVARSFDANAKAPTYLFVRGDDRSPDTSRPLTPAVPALLGGSLEIAAPPVSLADFRAALEPYVTAARTRVLAELTAAEATRNASPGPATQRKVELAWAAASALDARIAAERARYAEPPQTRAKELALAAGRAERHLAVLRAEEAQALAESGKDSAKLTAANKALADARTAAAKEDPSYPPLLPFSPTASSGRRLALARWIANRDNPLTARVLVNHVWMRHFGRPLVPTVANFGLSGKPPTHPELLDWLAVQFMDDGWSLKKLHRLLVTSQTYRLSTVDSAALSRDPDNRYLWRMNTRRMEAEAVRDSVLSVAGSLNPTMGGPPLDDKLGLTVPRRSLYFRFNTEYRMLFLEQFDAANPSECYERRESVIPQQALALANSSLVLTQARLLTERLMAALPTGSGDSAFIQQAFSQVLGRAPTAEEQTRCERFLRDQRTLLRTPAKLTPFVASADGVRPGSAEPAQRARENLVHVLFNHNDFVSIR